MHDGCSEIFNDGKQLADKVRMMGFDTMPIPDPLEMKCTHCSGVFYMDTMVSPCPDCRMVYAVTPCHADNASHVLAAGIDY